MPETQQSNGQFSDPLLERYFLSPTDKQNKEKGKAIVKAFYNSQITNETNLNFFRARNARWIMLMLWAKGSQRIEEFLDFMNISTALGNKAWVNIDTTQTRIAAQFVGTLVESMAKNKTYPCVEAIDDGSLSEKEDRLFEALFRMHEVQTINDLQQQSGMVLEPPTAYVPDDELSAKVYFELEDRLPKEIRFEKRLTSIQDDIFFERVANRKSLYDLTVVNAGFTKIERLTNKQYTVRKCIATNMVYNFFMNDTGAFELSEIGEFYNLKVKDFRAKLGKSKDNPEGLTEPEIFELAKLSTHKNNGIFNYTWDNLWGMETFNQNRPYDDCSILVLDAEIDCGEDVYYVEKTDSYGKKNITRKNGIPYQTATKDGIIQQPKPDNVEIIKRRKNSWMRGIYAPHGDKMLYWGRPDIIISPYTTTSKCLSSYTVNIPNNDGEYVPSLFERIMEPLREYQICKLKRKQLIAKLRPTGIRIDVENAKNIDLGQGNTFPWEEIIRVYDQTGNELYSSRGVNPLEREPPPLSPAMNNNDIQQILGLSETMLGIVGEIRTLIGVPMYRDGADVGDRTSGVLQEQQSTASYNVTDFILNANNQLWEETFYKLCLLYWNDVVKEEPESKEDMLNTRFKVSVKMKMSDYEKAQLEKDIDRYSQMPDAQGNPSLTLKDAMVIRAIDNEKLARWYLTKIYEENRRKAIEESQMLQQQNQQLQEQTAMRVAEKEAELQQKKLDAEKEMVEFKSTREKEVELLKGFLAVCGKDETGTLIKTLMPAIQQLVPNITIPLAQENAQMGQQMMANAIGQQMQQEQMMQQQEPQMQGENV